MPDSLQPHVQQHTRLLCPPLSPRVFSNSCPLSRWCHRTIFSSVTRFSSYPQSFPASGSFPVSQLSVSGVQSSGASALSTVLPRNTQGWFPLGFRPLCSLLIYAYSFVQLCFWFEPSKYLRLRPLYDSPHLPAFTHNISTIASLWSGS